MAQYYHILDIDSINLGLFATLCAGLPEESRVKRQESYSFEQYMLAGIFDLLHWIKWTKTEDGQKGRHIPKSIVNDMIAPAQYHQKDNGTAVIFESPEEFEREIQRRRRGHNG